MEVLEPPFIAFVGPLEAWAVEERAHIGLRQASGSAEPRDLHKGGRDAAGDRTNEDMHHLLSLLFVELSVLGDDPVIDAPGR